MENSTPPSFPFAPPLSSGKDYNTKPLEQLKRKEEDNIFYY